MKTNTTKNYIRTTYVKNVYGGHKKSRKLSEDKIIKIIKGKIIWVIKEIFEEDYHKPVTVGKSHSNYYNKYDSNGDRNKTLSNLRIPQQN